MPVLYGTCKNIKEPTVRNVQVSIIQYESPVLKREREREREERREKKKKKKNLKQIQQLRS